MGHYPVDALHKLLALMYRDSPSTSSVLERAGLSFFALRQFIQQPGRRGQGDLKRRPWPSLDGAIQVSPVFAVPVGAAVVGAVGLYLGPDPSLVTPLSLLFVVGMWVTSVCVHEFGHSLTAFLAGDRSVLRAGHLTLNPLKYTHPLLSVVLPVVFLLLGGFGLPGGAVHLDTRAMRRLWWQTLAFAVFIQLSAFIFNLLPLPPFDGFRVLAPWLPAEIQVLASRLSMAGLLFVYLFIWEGGPISAVIWNSVYRLTDLLQVPDFLILIGRH